MEPIPYHQTYTHSSIWLSQDDVTLNSGSLCLAMCLCVCACVKDDSEGHYSLIRPLWSTQVIFSAEGLPRATSTISHLTLTIYPGDKQPDPSTVAEVAWDWNDARQPPQQCLRWVLMKSLDISLAPDHTLIQPLNWKIMHSTWLMFLVKYYILYWK